MKWHAGPGIPRQENDAVNVKTLREALAKIDRLELLVGEFACLLNSMPLGAHSADGVEHYARAYLPSEMADRVAARRHPSSRPPAEQPEPAKPIVPKRARKAKS